MKIEITGRYAKLILQDTDGRVFFTTDIHGQWDLLQGALEILGFVNFPHEAGGEKADQLISLGDMVDRGEKSLHVAQAFRYNPNYFSLCGNHERMALAGTQLLPEKRGAITLQGHDRTFWIDQGGDWHKPYDFYAVKELTEWAGNLPYAAEIELDGHKIGLTHAEVVDPNFLIESEMDWFSHNDYHWDDTKSVASKPDSDNLSYERVREYALTFCRRPTKQNIHLDVKGVDVVLHGHTVSMNEPAIRGNQVYFDGGAPFMTRSGGETYSLNILEYAPAEDAIMGLFKLHQFYYNEDGVIDIR